MFLNPNPSSSQKAPKLTDFTICSEFKMAFGVAVEVDAKFFPQEVILELPWFALLKKNGDGFGDLIARFGHDDDAGWRCWLGVFSADLATE